MRQLTIKHWLFILVAFTSCAGGYAIYRAQTASPTFVTALVERGAVTETVSVSGFVEAQEIAQLGFPTTGVVTDIFVKEGDTVARGALLATLGDAQLVAERAAAQAVLDEAQAGKAELLAGPTSESRAVTSASLAAAAASLEKTIATEAAKVQSARTALRSNDLEALADDVSDEATPPIITGSYTCDTEGSYKISVYRSSTVSGYSFSFSGIESGSGTVTTDQPAPLGTCGLYTQFVPGISYGQTNWTIAVPNTKSSTYASVRNAYELALAEQEKNVQAAKDAFTITKNEAAATNATARPEALNQASASVRAATARIAAIDAQIANLSIAAPFSGTVTDVAIVSGETASLNPVMTFLGTSAFEIKARVPEIDITKIALNQPAFVRFDAQPKTEFTGIITYVSPVATEIDGVAYFETTITLQEGPTWLKDGFNADVEIIVSEQKNVLRLPRRFVTTVDDTSTVLVLDGKTTTTEPVTIETIGNDGFVAISGISEGAVVVAP